MAEYVLEAKWLARGRYRKWRTEQPKLENSKMADRTRDGTKWLVRGRYKNGGQNITRGKYNMANRTSGRYKMADRTRGA
jgi:hypothetical protein